VIKNNQFRRRDKPPRRLAAWLVRCLETAENSLSRENDAFAREHGWRIEGGHRGLRRRYRDPRFDRLAECPKCYGTGSSADHEPCLSCSGSGRVALAPRFVAEDGVGR
jgi:hypothetical protein